MNRRTFAIRYLFIFALSIVLAVGYTGAQEDDSAEEQPFEDFDYENFDNPTIIDNEWFPLQPGMQYIYEGVTDEDGEAIPHRVITTVTDLTKEVDGIRSVVIWDQDFSDEELVETEIAFFAQDNDGNVWRIGEYPEEYEEGEVIDAPAWIAGQEEAKAGIHMKGEPTLDTPSYSQGWAPAVEFTDRAQVFAVGEETCVPFDCYENVLVIDEFNPDEPDAYQQKYYASEVGLVRVGWRGDDATQETLELIEVIELDEDALTEAREAALEIEARAYENAADVYGETAPAEQTAGEDM
jgi:hypothetical protein